MVNQRQTILWVNIFLLFASILCKSKHLDDFMVHIGKYTRAMGMADPQKSIEIRVVVDLVVLLFCGFLVAGG